MGKKKRTFKYIDKAHPEVMYRAVLKDGTVFDTSDNLASLVLGVKEAGVTKQIARYDALTVFSVSNGWKKMPKPDKLEIETFAALGRYNNRNGRIRSNYRSLYDRS